MKRTFDEITFTLDKLDMSRCDEIAIERFMLLLTALSKHYARDIVVSDIECTAFDYEALLDKHSSDDVVSYSARVHCYAVLTYSSDDDVMKLACEALDNDDVRTLL